MAEGMRFGYVRVSTIEQNEGRQMETLTAYGLRREDITVEKLSGKDRNRPGLESLLGKVRAGDSLVVTSIDRLGRSTRDILNIVAELDDKGVTLVCLNQSLDTSTPMGKCVLTILASFAELERNNIKERQAEGIALAKREGRYKGRGKKALPELEAIWGKWKRKEVSAAQAAKLLDVSRSTFYRRVGQLEETQIIDL